MSAMNSFRASLITNCPSEMFSPFRVSWPHSSGLVSPGKLDLIADEVVQIVFSLELCQLITLNCF